MGWIQTLRNKLREHRFDGYTAIDCRPIKERISFYEPLIKKIFNEQKLDPIFGMAIAMQESSFRTTAVAVTGGDEKVGGSYGLMMVSAKTSYALGFRGDPIDLCLPEIGILWASKVIKDDISWAKITDFRDLVSVYNSGKLYANAPQCTRNVYVINVLKYAAQFRHRNLIR